MKRIFFLILLFLFAHHLQAEEILTWKDCVNLAIANNPELQSAKEKLAQAKANAGVTKSALLPQVDANVSASKNKTATENIDNTDNAYSYGITGKQLLFDSGKAIYDLKSSQKKAESANYNYQASSANIRQKLRYSFIQLLTAQEEININKDIIAIRQRNLDLVTMRYKSGLEHRGSLLTAEANLAQAQHGLSSASRNVDLAQAGIAKNTGVQTSKLYKAAGDLEIKISYSQKPDFAALANAHPELKSIVEQRAAAQYAATSSKMDYSPKVYGLVSAERSGNEWNAWNGSQSNQYSAGIQLSLNLFQGGKSYYNTSLTEAQYKQLFADEKSTRSTIILTLEQAWINLQNSIETVNVQYKYLKAAEERANIADAQYSIGTIVFDNWTIIQDNLVSAKKNYLSALANAMLSETDWILANGGTLNYEE